MNKTKLEEILKLKDQQIYLGRDKNITIEELIEIIKEDILTKAESISYLNLKNISLKPGDKVIKLDELKEALETKSTYVESTHGIWSHK